MSFRMGEYVIKKVNFWNNLALLLGTAVFREKKRETRCLSKIYNFEFYFMLYKVEKWEPKDSNARHAKSKNVK